MFKILLCRLIVFKYMILRSTPNLSRSKRARAHTHVQNKLIPVGTILIKRLVHALVRIIRCNNSFVSTLRLQATYDYCTSAYVQSA